jgi:hypothetical protein
MLLVIRQELYKKGAKPRRSYKLASTGTVSEVSKADIYVAKGIGFKQVDLNMFTVVLPWSDKYGEEDEEQVCQCLHPSMLSG